MSIGQWQNLLHLGNTNMHLLRTLFWDSAHVFSCQGSAGLFRGGHLFPSLGEQSSQGHKEAEAKPIPYHWLTLSWWRRSGLGGPEVRRRKAQPNNMDQESWVQRMVQEIPQHGTYCKV